MSGTEIKDKRVKLILAGLRELYPDAGCALEHKNIFELLAATILSAQCTDERVNKITPGLFAKYPDPASMAEAEPEDIEKIIRSAGFYKSKARSLKEASAAIVKNFGGKVPRTMEELISLRGVARKTANVVMGTGYGIAAGIVVDTHVKRLSFRLGFSSDGDPVKIEKTLMKLVPKDMWIWLSHALIMHGRGPCGARRPRCGECGLSALCPKKGL